MSDHNGSLLRRGGTARFVRWLPGREGWYPEITEGRYVRKVKEGWVVTIEGDTTVLPDDVWCIYR